MTTVSGHTGQAIRASTGFRTRLAWCVALPAVLISVVVSALSAGVPAVLDTPMAEHKPWWTVSAVPLFETGGPPPPVYVIWMQVKEPLVLLQHPEIRIPFESDRLRPGVTAALLAMEGTSCEYRTEPGTHRQDGWLLRLLAGPACRPLNGTPSRRLKLTVHTDARQRISLRGFSQGTSAHSLAGSTVEILGLDDDGGPYPILDGKYVAHAGQSGLRRIDLLSYVWQISPSATWIWIGVSTAGVLLLAGMLVFPIGDQSPANQRSVAARAGAGALCLAGGWALLYAIVVPPFQAPDEPNHLLSYGTLTSNPAIQPDTEEWARRTHFERITFNSDERFRPADMVAPWTVAWRDHVSAANQGTRGRTTVILWHAAARLLGPMPAPQTLLALRLINALLFALAVAVAAMALAGAAAVPSAHLVTLVFLLVPALPFFAVGVSNHAVLVSIYVPLAGAAGAQLLGGGRLTVAAVVLGAGTAALIASGISALPALMLVAFVLLARALLGSPGASRQRNPRFWLLFGASACLVAVFVRPDHTAEVFSKAGPYRQWLVAAIRYAPLVLLVIAALGALIDGAFRRALTAAASSRPRIVAAATAGLRLTAAALLAVLAGSLFITYPSVIPMELQPRWPTALEYVKEILLSGGTIGRIAAPDWLLSSSFWAGFGWLDTFPGAWLVNLLTGATTLMLALLLFRLAAARDAMRGAWLFLLVCGGGLTLALYAAGGQASRTNVHGRYLIGLYLCGLVVAWSGLAWTGRRRSAWRLRGDALLALTGAVHAFSVWFLLSRYF